MAENLLQMTASMHSNMGRSSQLSEEETGHGLFAVSASEAGEAQTSGTQSPTQHTDQPDFCLPSLTGADEGTLKSLDTGEELALETAGSTDVLSTDCLDKELQSELPSFPPPPPSIEICDKEDEGEESETGEEDITVRIVEAVSPSSTGSAHCDIEDGGKERPSFFV
jgi:hypothetical protein